MTIKEQRESVIKEAMSWLRTPYHHMGRVKGAGADCATFLVCVYENAGLTEKIELDFYPNDWHMHQTEEKYLKKILDFTHRVKDPKPGDIVLFRYGLTAAHGGIIYDWPTIIHAAIHLGVCATNAQSMMNRLVGFFSPNIWREDD